MLCFFSSCGYSKQLLETRVLSGHYIYLETPTGCKIFYKLPKKKLFFNLDLSNSYPGGLYLGISATLHTGYVTFYEKGYKVPKEIQEQQNKLENKTSLESLSELPLHLWPTVMEWIPTPYDDEMTKDHENLHYDVYHREGNREWIGSMKTAQCRMGSEEWICKAQEDIIKHLTLCSYNYYEANDKQILSQNQLLELADQIKKCIVQHFHIEHFSKCPTYAL